MVDIHAKDPMAMCPMASMCKGMAEKPPSLPLLMIPGSVLIVFGILILLEPRILIWLVAAATIAIGVLLLVMATWFRRMTPRLSGFHT